MQRGLLIYDMARIDLLFFFADSLAQDREPLPRWFSEIVETWFKGVVLERKRSAASIRDVVKIFAKVHDHSSVEHWLFRYTDEVWFAPYIRYGGIGELDDQSQFETEIYELAQAYVWADDLSQALKLAETLKDRTPIVLAKIIREMNERDRFAIRQTYKN